ncbi:unnamed protein product [Rotaria socialis]|uniref:Uncharacterized protein n=1 Tax=Rotaria socialis TaxID=392032 RepID=A0A820X5A2_9BILA|nr:unnamed protein product [Rotaria socialis]CAF4527083.1 unnamed protein product [Rotaria socialis]
MYSDTIFVISNKTNKRRERVVRRRSIIRQFALNTSTHGIPGIARSESMHNRIFWSISFVVFTGITIFFVTQEIRKYFEYSTQTSVDIVNEWPQHFPAFTICNLAPVRYDLFVQSFSNYTTTLNITNANDTNSMSLQQIKRIGDFFQMKINRNESLDEFFFPLSSMLMTCVFNGRACSVVNFTSFSSSSYGFCYTFNAKLKNINSVHYSDEYGGPGLLNLGFYVHSHQYVPYIREGVGMIAVLHDNAQLPMIDSAGMALATGFKHRITYTKKMISFLRSPYSTCDDKIPPMMQAMFDNYQGTEYGYTEDICYELCTQVFTYKHCGCIDPLQWNARWVFLPETEQMILAPLCNISNKCYSEAAYVFLTSSSLLEQHCSYCPQQCFITDFSIKNSLWRTPPAWLVDDIKRFVENSKIPLPHDWLTNWRSHIDASYLSIELVHESTRIENYTQAATLTAVGVLSNVGGQTGLWIGVSFLSLMELAEMLYRLARQQYHTMRRNCIRTSDESKV